jgi:hypothetical protein
VEWVIKPFCKIIDESIALDDCLGLFHRQLSYPAFLLAKGGIIYKFDISR